MDSKAGAELGFPSLWSTLGLTDATKEERGLVLVSHVGESTEAGGGDTGVFSLKLRGNLSVCDKNRFSTRWAW